MKSGKSFTIYLVLSMLIMATGFMALADEVSNFSGTWKTNFGPLKIQQKGVHVTGTYEYERKGNRYQGKIEGVVMGDRLVFKWSQSPSWAPPAEAGDAYLVLTHEEEDIVVVGEWRYGHAGAWAGEWKGYLVEDSPKVFETPPEDDTIPEDKTQPSGTRGGPMVFVPEGEFIMGRVESEDSHFDEGPAHKVYLDAFYIDKYEVTNEEFNKCAKSGPCGTSDAFYYKGFDGPRQPVIGVSWYQAYDYCEWVGKRLPTDAEWEKAARGTDGRSYPWGEELSCKMANYGLCGNKTTRDVGSYPLGASPYGALDMAGNVQEWTFDWYDRWYHENAPYKNPKVMESQETVHMNKARVTRGGSWRADYKPVLRTTYRYSWPPISRHDFYGFRCAKSAEGK